MAPQPLDTAFTPLDLANCAKLLGVDPLVADAVDVFSPSAIVELFILCTTAPMVGGVSTVADVSAVDAKSIALAEFCQAVVNALAVPVV